jgi:hypothetical protein
LSIFRLNPKELPRELFGGKTELDELVANNEIIDKLGPIQYAFQAFI